MATLEIYPSEHSIKEWV